MLLEKIIAGPYDVNCYIIGDEKTGKAAVIDPGGNENDIIQILEKHKMDLEFIILTHGHGDHTGGLENLKTAMKVPVYLHKDDSYILKNKNYNYSVLISGKAVEMEPDRYLNDKDALELGKLKLHIIHTPGHTPGGICIYAENVIFTGDTLFNGSVGRTDLEGGDHDILISSIKNKLMVLDDDTTVYPGHGSPTKIGAEKASNPFLK